MTHSPENRTEPRPVVQERSSSALWLIAGIVIVAAIIGIVVYLVLQATGFERLTAGYAGMATIVAIRFTAIFFALRMPALRLGAVPKQD